MITERSPIRPDLISRNQVPPFLLISISLESSGGVVGNVQAWAERHIQ